MPQPPSGHSALPTTHSLAAAIQAATRQGEPLVVMTTLAGCPYCDVVRQHHLLPMQRSGQIQVVQLDMTDRRSTLTGPDGRATTPAQQVQQWGAKLAPTLLFLGLGGEELAERLVGMPLPEFYASYLNDRLAEARQRLRKGKH